VNRALPALAAAMFACLALTRAHAVTPAAARTPVPVVTVVGTTPVPGAVIDIDKVPSNVESVSAADLTRNGSASLTGALSSQLGNININDTLADPFQPDLFYRGFAASPVLGTQEGLAVYQNGVRINEAFGDAVNWDLLPDIAIGRIDLLSANPVYGLNALGGAAAITMKDGFSYQGAEAELAGGSFRQHSAAAQLGANKGGFGFYAGGRILNEDGWRLFAHDRIRQLYTALSEHAAAATFDLTYSHADNALYGQGAAPVQSLALDRRNVFTEPQANLNRLDFVTLDGSYTLAQELSAQSVVYYRSYRQSVANGNTSDFTACNDSSGLLCQPDGATPLSDASGNALPDISNGGATPVGQNDFENIHSRAAGGSLQLHGTHAMAGLGNQFTAGVSIDVDHTDFFSGMQVGAIGPNLVVQPTDFLVATPEGAQFSATPVILEATNKYYGFFATDTVDVGPALAITGSARYNVAQIDLHDRRGTELNGLNRYTHFNPALGATYKVTDGVTAYGGYSRTNRTPTASEIECSDPLLPCLLPANLAGDPPTLKQVIADTYELGLRGKVRSPAGVEGLLTWDVGGFRTNLSHDIFAIATSLSSGFFQNVGATRRAGAQASVAWRWTGGQAYLSYSYVDATFQSAFGLSSPSNPARDENGDIQVQPGDRLPGIPRQRVKAGLDYNLLPQLTVGGTLVYVSSQFYRGDESNQNAPLPGYGVVGLHGSWRFWKHSELFFTVSNLFDKHYATYGIFADPTGVGAPGIARDARSNDPGVDNRFQSPGAPRSYFGGVRIQL
jgi:iron complex outermembrane recepter protein